MEDKALVWFQDVEESGQFMSWEAFVRALHVRFGASAYDDPLARLRQVSSVAIYDGQFKALSNRINEISEKHKLSCFLSGLKDEIRLPVRMLNPQNLNTAFGLAKIQEEYLPASKKIRPWNDNQKGLIFGPPPLIKNEARDAKLPI